MPKQPTSNPKQFIQGAPVLAVPDVKATAAYYEDILGFNNDFHWEDKNNHHYAVVWRDNSAIHLATGEEPPKGIALFQWVSNVDEYYQEVADRGADICMELTNQTYGIREFSILDINGIRINVGQDIE